MALGRVFSISYHPYMPQKAGFPGLYLNICSADEIEDSEKKDDRTKEAKQDEGIKAEDEENKSFNLEGVRDDGIDRVFVRLAPRQWLYVGQYKIEHKAILSGEEWVELSDKAKLAWIKGALTNGWGEEMRARAHLMNSPGSGRRYTKQELHSLLSNKKEVANLEITAEQMTECFAREEYRVTVATMTCVGYQHEFQRRMVDVYPKWLEENPGQAPKVQGAPKGKTRRRESEGTNKKGPKPKKVKTEARTRNTSKTARKGCQLGRRRSADFDSSEYDEWYWGRNQRIRVRIQYISPAEPKPTTRAELKSWVDPHSHRSSAPSTGC
ncbi:hypothetical protein L218DRAFT_376638 [Marasmius fiardii PR-910]|nr:hypothetical protein L218DRAFT_376638 [Marasmius fiardii PR-910]